MTMKTPTTTNAAEVLSDDALDGIHGGEDRVRFRRTNIGLFTLDIGTVENVKDGSTSLSG